MTVIPTIATARLLLRAHRLEDYDAACEMWADPLVTRFIGGKPSTRQQTWSRLLGYLGHWPVMNYGYWAIEERESGRFIGEAGFADFKREIAPAMQNVPELGFALASSAHGKGYGTEAVRAILEWGDANLPSQRTVCMVNEDNAGSLAIVKKVGYRIFDSTTFGESRVAFLERLATDKDPTI
jgi:RimJ/RimL family protein N-acetyltransferase